MTAQWDYTKPSKVSLQPSDKVYDQFDPVQSVKTIKSISDGIWYVSGGAGGSIFVQLLLSIASSSKPGNKSMAKHKELYKWSRVNGMSGSEDQMYTVMGNVIWCNDPSEFPDDEQQYIVAAKFTTPDWFDTFMSGRVLGLVTKVGGYLSHAAITARELKIPCVLQARVAAKKLANAKFAIIMTRPETGTMFIANPIKVKVVDNETDHAPNV